MTREAHPPGPVEELLRNGEWVRALARSLALDSADAEDIAQDAMAIALRTPPEAGRPLRPWLVRVVANLARKRVREDVRRRDREHGAHDPKPLPTPGELYERIATQQDVVHAVMGLDEPYRSTILLRYYEGLPAAEIARRQGTEAATVRQRIKRGLERLRESLRSRYGDDDTKLFGALRRLARPETAPGAIAGGLLMKQATLGLAIVLALAGLWKFGPALLTPASEERLAGPTEGSREGSLTSRAQPSIVAGAEPARVPAGEPARVATALASGSLLVSVSRDPGAVPLAGEVVLVRWSAGAEDHEDHVLRTDERGSARLPDLAPGRLRIGSVRFGDDYEWVDVVPGGEVEVRLSVLPGIRLNGRVVDSAGRGVSGAEILVSEPWDRMRGHAITTADGQGRFVIEAAQPNGQNWIGARAPGRAQSLWHYLEEDPSGEAELTIVLEREGFRLRGAVVDRQGVPVAGARLWLGFESAEASSHVTESSEESTSWGSGPPRQTSSSVDGSFSFQSLPAGPAPLLVRAPGLGLHRAEIEVGRSDDLRIVLGPDARLSGVVRDGLLRPVVGAIVFSDERGMFASRETLTGADGRFQLSGLPVGPTQLTAMKKWSGRAGSQLVLAEGGENEWSPTLTEAPRIFGRVLDPGGEPVPGVRLSAWVPVDGEPIEFTETTDGLGRYSFDELPDRRHALRVHVDPVRYVRFMLYGVSPSTDPLDVRLEDLESTSGLLLGRILGPDGRAVPGAGLEIEHLTRLAVGDFALADDRTGRFEQRIPAGRCRLVARAGGHPDLQLGERELRTGLRLDLGTLELTEPAFVTATLEGAEDQLASLSVFWVDASERWLGSSVRTEREFRSPPLPPGTVRMLVQGEFVEDFAAEFEVEAGARATSTHALRRVGVAVIVLEFPVGTERRGSLWGELSDGEGRIVWQSDRPVPPVGPWELRASAPEGTWHFLGGTNFGLTARGEVAVPVAGQTFGPVRLTLSRE